MNREHSNSLQALKPSSPQALKPSSLQALKPSSPQAFKPSNLQALNLPQCATGAIMQLDFEHESEKADQHELACRAEAYTKQCSEVGRERRFCKRDPGGGGGGGRRLGRKICATQARRFVIDTDYRLNMGAQGFLLMMGDF